MFQFPGFPSIRYGLAYGYMRFAHVGFPIQRSPDQWIFAPPRSFSQLITSFIASESLGIHHTPLIIYSNFILSAYSEIINVVKHLYNFCFCSLLWNIFFHLSSMSKNCVLTDSVENKGVEPLTSCVQSRRSSQLS